jgi:hypothetical protein
MALRSSFFALRSWLFALRSKFQVSSLIFNFNFNFNFKKAPSPRKKHLLKHNDEKGEGVRRNSFLLAFKLKIGGRKGYVLGSKFQISFG